MESKNKNLMTLGELREKLKIYGDEFYISFGDKYLTRVDNRDTDIIFCEWISIEESDYLEKP